MQRRMLPQKEGKLTDVARIVLAQTDATKVKPMDQMSIKKSNWSDLDNALAMSARESVRRLFESATMKARAVISAMNTGVRCFSSRFLMRRYERLDLVRWRGVGGVHTFACFAEQNWSYCIDSSLSQSIQADRSRCRVARRTRRRAEFILTTCLRRPH